MAEPAGRRRAVFVSAAVIAVALCLLGVSFAGSSPSRPTRFGPVLGADYPNYYVAARALNEGRTADLYDDAAERRAYHELFPEQPATEQLPFLYPSWVAEAFRPLALLPYRASFAVFLLLAGAVYLFSLSLLRPLASSVSDRDWRLFLLLAVAFQPFLFEGWMGGQLSVVGMLAVCLAIRLAHDHRPLAAGLALGLLAYKPTLLLFLGLMTVVARRWRTVAGLAVACAASFAASALLTGPGAVHAYVDRVLGFHGTDLVVPLWKYVDVRSLLEALVGRGSPVALAGALLAMGVAVAALIGPWRRSSAVEAAAHHLTWASTLTVTLVANLYVPVYDVALLVPSLLLTWLVLGQDRRRLFLWLVGAICAVAWFTQPLARATGIQLQTLLLVALAVYQLRALRAMSRPAADRAPDAVSLDVPGSRGGVVTHV